MQPVEQLDRHGADGVQETSRIRFYQVCAEQMSSPTLTGACSGRALRTTVITLFKLRIKMGAQTSRKTGTCPRVKTLSSYKRAGGKSRGQDTD